MDWINPNKEKRQDETFRELSRREYVIDLGWKGSEQKSQKKMQTSLGY